MKGAYVHVDSNIRKRTIWLSHLKIKYSLSYSFIAVLQLKGRSQHTFMFLK